MVWAVENEKQTRAIQEISSSQSDRAVALVCSAIVEERLLLCLKWRLRPVDLASHVKGLDEPCKNLVQNCFSERGPLGNFASKITLGYFISHLR